MEAPSRFIVVDDDPLNNLVCKHIILKSDKDASVTLFTDPEKALETIGKFTDIMDQNEITLFLDINMPVISGWEFLEEFANLEEQIQKQISIYILSSSIDDGDLERAASSAIVKGYYQKPLSLETINIIKSKRAVLLE